MSYLKAKNTATTTISVPNFLSGVNCAYDQSVLSQSVAANCYNFEFSSGALKGCKGFTSIDTLADSVWTYKKGDVKYLMWSYDGEIFYKIGDEVKKLDGIKLSGVPKAISYRLYGEDVILICSPSDNMVVWNGTDAAYYVSSSPYITSMTVHYERMFVTTGNEVNTLWFSDDLDPSNWNTDMTEGGFIELADERGKLIKVLGFLNYVYIFRERGISRLTAYADQSEFSVTHLFVTGGKIYPDSVALCGDRVIFASSDGLFSFDGVSTKRILTNLDGLFCADENSVAVYHGGKYYLALKADFGIDDGFDADYVHNAVLIYGDDGFTIMRGYDVSSFYSDGDTLYAIIGGQICEQKGDCFLPKRWSMPLTDLGSGRTKRIKTLCLDTSQDVTLTVTLDEAKRDFFVKGSNVPSIVNINMRGRKFALTINSSSANPHVSRPQLKFTYAD